MTQLNQNTTDLQSILDAVNALPDEGYDKTEVDAATEDIAAAIEGKGVEVPDGTALDGMAALIDVIESGGGFPNGTKWTDTNISTAQCIKYANGLWVAGGYYSLYYSTNGKDWIDGEVSDYPFSIIDNANGIWVAGTSGYGLLYSLDGTTWTQSNVTSGSVGSSLYYANGIWAACCATALYYSTDGKTWSFIRKDDGYLIEGSTYAFYSNGIWVYGTSKGLWYSNDGMTSVTQSNITSGYFYSLEYANGLWVAGCKNGLYYSTDGMIWTQSNITSGTFRVIHYANGIWAAGCDTGLYYSTDGKTWTLTNITDRFVYRLYNAVGIWILGTYDGNGLYYSTDGITWTQSNVTSGYTYSLHYANGIWVTGCDGTYYSVAWEPSE